MDSIVSVWRFTDLTCGTCAAPPSALKQRETVSLNRDRFSHLSGGATGRASRILMEKKKDMLKLLSAGLIAAAMFASRHGANSGDAQGSDDAEPAWSHLGTCPTARMPPPWDASPAGFRRPPSRHRRWHGLWPSPTRPEQRPHAPAASARSRPPPYDHCAGTDGVPRRHATMAGRPSPWAAEARRAQPLNVQTLPVSAVD